MKVTYIDHSGFALEYDECTILIDYYHDTRGDREGYVHDVLLTQSQPLYVLVSHVHADHFNPEILSWYTQRAHVRYLFSSDVRPRIENLDLPIIYLKVGENYTDDMIDVTAFGSTDAGISFLLTIENEKILHAGDLNNWHWQEESTPEESKEYEAAFLRELSRIAYAAPSLFLAMFPVDPRLGRDYGRGACQLMDVINVRNFIPMHFQGDYRAANSLAEYAETHHTQFLPLHSEGEQYIL